MRSAVVVKTSGTTAFVRAANGQVTEAVMLLPVSVGQKVTVQEIDPPSGQLVCIGPINYSTPVYAVDGAAGVPSLRTLGSGAQQAAPGDHLHAPQSFPSDGPAAVASLRTLGTGGLQAAAGNHTHSSPADLPVSAPRGRVLGVKRTIDLANQAAETVILTGSFTVDATRYYEVIGSAFLSNLTAAATIGLYLRAAAGGTVTTASSRLTMARVAPATTAGGAAQRATLIHPIEPGDLPNGQYTFGVSAVRDDGTGNWSCYAQPTYPALLLVKDMGGI